MKRFCKGVKRSVYVSLIMAGTMLLSAQVNGQTWSQTAAGTYSWSVPAGVTKAVIQTWGGGGAGGGSTSKNKSGGGGGGGGYTKTTVTGLTSGTSYSNNVVVGLGGTGVQAAAGNNGQASTVTLNPVATVTAAGGGGGGAGSNSAQGTAGAAGVGGTYNGGAGSGGKSAGAGGGGGAGTASNGTSLTVAQLAGATAVAGGGPGGDGGSPTGLVPASGPSGGGGGGDKLTVAGVDATGGNGYSGQVIIEFYPEFALSANAQTPGDKCEGATNQVIHSFIVTGINNSTITAISFVTTGTYAAAEISNFKLYYTTNSTFATTNLLATIGSPAVAGPQSFTGFSQAINFNTTYYFWITMDVAAAVTDGKTIAVNATASGNITSTVGTIVTGSTSASSAATLKDAPTAAAGSNMTTCANSGAINITGGSSASGHSSIEWTSSGNGTFTNATSLTTCTYAPSPDDTTAGSVTLTLTAYGTCTNTPVTKTLTISPSILVGAGGAMDPICKSSTSAALGGSKGPGVTTAIWDDGVATGTFSNNDGSTPGTATYTSSATSGTVTLTLTATAACGTAAVSKNITVKADVGTPVFTLGGSSTRCAGAYSRTYTATATNSDTYTYELDPASISGNCTINASTGAVVFHPSYNGSSTITVKANGCGAQTQETHTVNIIGPVSSPAFIDIH